MTDPSNPKPGDRFVLPRGEIRIDDVRNGWVYFVQWTGDADIGAPTRMTMETFVAALAKEMP